MACTKLGEALKGNDLFQCSSCRLGSKPTKSRCIWRGRWIEAPRSCAPGTVLRIDDFKHPEIEWRRTWCQCPIEAGKPRSHNSKKSNRAELEPKGKNINDRGQGENCEGDFFPPIHAKIGQVERVSILSSPLLCVLSDLSGYFPLP
jgi:hypothetical protein